MNNVSFLLQSRYNPAMFMKNLLVLSNTGKPTFPSSARNRIHEANINNLAFAFFLLPSGELKNVAGTMIWRNVFQRRQRKRLAHCFKVIYLLIEGKHNAILLCCLKRVGPLF